MSEPVNIGNIDDDDQNANWLRELNEAAQNAGIDTSGDEGEPEE